MNSFRFTRSPDFRIREVMLNGEAWSLAEAEGAVWIGYQDRDANRKATANGLLARVDPKTNAITATVPVGRYPWRMVAAPSGLWVLSYLDSAVTRIDPRTDAVMATIRVPERPTGLVSGGGYIWVVSQSSAASPSSGSVARIDPETGAIGEVPGAPKDVGNIAFLDGRFFMSEQEGKFGIWEFDPLGGEPARKIMSCCQLLGVKDKRTLWLWKFGLRRYDLKGENAKPVAFPNLPNPGSPVVRCGARYCFASPRGEIIEFDSEQPEAQPVVKEMVAPASLIRSGLLSADGSLWVIPDYSYSVLRLDPK